MRLWHQDLISKLPRQQLLGQHRECCALRGKGWGRPHSVVNYVFSYSPEYLVAYHYLIMDEMVKRGYNPDAIWRNPNWRGKELKEDNWIKTQNTVEDETPFWLTLASQEKPIYKEHDNNYLKECIENLKAKGIELN